MMNLSNSKTISFSVCSFESSARGEAVRFQCFDTYLREKGKTKERHTANNPDAS
ncbi:Uncharacterized protein APZ42_027453 [Daphnia magna]|uniref:Uncharacterized protein n=1 Tax=Daphnia magna TaxID=35525 RepID=A0A0P5DR26_9CRUS|nr:Uncharacterized protein APZ42_027453 [Daphnia magna]